MNNKFKIRVVSILFLNLLFCLFLLSCSSSPQIKQSNIAIVKNNLTQKAINYKDQYESLSNLDFENINKFNFNEEQKYFLQTLKLIKLNKYEEAKPRLIQLSDKTNDSILRISSIKILVDLLFFDSKWNEIYILDSNMVKPEKDETNSQILIESFRKSLPEKVTFIEDSCILKAMFTETGVPIIEIFINGKPCLFWFDTGANYCAISSDIANECDIRPLIFESSRALTGTTRKVEIFPAIVEQMTIGSVNFENHPFIIVHDFDLRIKLFGTSSTTKIEGIIGWKAIQNMDIEIDYINKKMTIRKPIINNTVKDRNLFWLGCPIVNVFSTDGTELHFGLDLGAEKTTITNNIFKKISFEKIYSTTSVLGSVGGYVFNNSKMVAELNLIIDGNHVQFNDIGTGFQQKQLFIQLDGILGSDFLRKHNIRIDWLNGRFDFKTQGVIN